MVTQILTWWFVVQALGLAGLPLTTVLLRALPDRGYAFGKTLGLLLTGYLTWLLAMLGLVPFGAPLLIICALLVGGAGLLLWRGEQYGRGGRGILALLPPLPALIAYEALFLAALVFLSLLRATNPDPWGTERPMDFAFFNAIRQSTIFPPHDPWLSGYSINYYYFGYLLMAVVAVLSNLEPSVAFNLSLALIFALAALGVAGLIVNLIALTRNPAHRDQESEAGDRERSTRHSTRGSWFAALGAVVLVLFAANQGGALEIISGTPMILALEGRDMARALINGLGSREPLVLEHEFRGWDFDATRVITPGDTVANFNWWNPSRALWDDFTRLGIPERRYAITEFPFFSFWLGDMHPHVMALPFGLLALALALQTLARQTMPGYALGQRGWVELLVSGVVLGSLYTINSWDFPTYLLLFLGALLLLYLRSGGGRDAGQGAPAWRQYLIQALLVVIAALVLFTPFYLTFRSLVGARDPLIDLPILSTITRTIGFVTWAKTPLHTFLIIFGLFLLPLVTYVAVQGRGLATSPAAADEPAAGNRQAPPPQQPGVWQQIAAVPRSGWSTLQLMPWITLVTLCFGLLIGFPLLALMPLSVYAAMLAAARLSQPAAAFVLWAFSVACLICLGTEVVYIRDVFESRMNTIFKFYYQVWLIWGVLAGYALWWLYRCHFPARRFGGYLLGILCAPLLVGALSYPWLTAGKTFREPVWVGLMGKTPRQATPAGAAAIEWLRANVPGDAVVLEASGALHESYDPTGQGIGGVAASTGLATVLGWPGHEAQWRGGDPKTLALLQPREADVTSIYSTTDVAQARALLDRYGVDYIYVGGAERAKYPQVGLAKLAQLGTIVFQQDEVAIYQVGGPAGG